jgi:hypothetical protein
MTRPPVDLSAHINETVVRGHPADFPVSLRPVFVGNDDGYRPVPHRRAVVRDDSGAPIAVLSDRYQLVPHQRILDLVEEAIRPLDVGPVPRGIFVDRGGARMRALFKFPSLAKPVVRDDTICPCLKIQNTYDGTSRISIHIGAFRFVCTNLAVGGGGVFAGGFMSVHAGEIPIEEVAAQLASYLVEFGAIVALYRSWTETVLNEQALAEILESFPKRSREAIEKRVHDATAVTVYEAYNLATWYATHEMRSYRTAFDLLALANRSFQREFPVPETARPADTAGSVLTVAAAQ